MVTETQMNGRLELDVGGMTCGSCARAIERALSSMAGVAQARVDASTGRTVVTGSASVAQVISSIEAMGYTARIAIGAAHGGDGHERRTAGCCR